jgi:hypothetical protein
MERQNSRFKSILALFFGSPTTLTVGVDIPSNGHLKISHHVEKLEAASYKANCKEILD